MKAGRFIDTDLGDDSIADRLRSSPEEMGRQFEGTVFLSKLELGF